jgi:hypothetical protein
MGGRIRCHLLKEQRKSVEQLQMMLDKLSQMNTSEQAQAALLAEE